MIITTSYLLSRGACSDHVAIFREIYPGGIDVAACDIPTEARRIAAAKLDLRWGADNLLDAPTQREYDEALAPARREYSAACAAARAAYDTAAASAVEAYYAACASARAARDAATAGATAGAWLDCEAPAASAVEAYYAALAIALLTALRAQGAAVGRAVGVSR